MTTNELACILTFEHLHNIGVSGGDICRNLVYHFGTHIEYHASEQASKQHERALSDLKEYFCVVGFEQK